MAAGLPAADLAGGLYRVDPPQAVSKCIGETGKNVDEAVPPLGTTRLAPFIEEVGMPLQEAQKAPGREPAQDPYGRFPVLLDLAGGQGRAQRDAPARGARP